MNITAARMEAQRKYNLQGSNEANNILFENKNGLLEVVADPGGLDYFRHLEECCLFGYGIKMAIWIL